MEYKDLFGIRFNNVDMQETVGIIDSYLKSDKTNVMTVINASKLSKMQKDEELRKSINDSDIVLADGLPVVWASRFLGKPLKDRVAGCDLFQELAKQGNDKDYRIFLLGAKEEVVKKVKEIFNTKYPGLTVSGYRNGYFSVEDEEEVCRQINDSGANMLFLGFSSPKKEQFVSRNKDRLKNIRFIQGVGGSFDIVAGVTRRAPVWMQKCGLEWFYRFLQEPGRMWKRYLLTNTAFLVIVLKEFFKKS